MVYRDEEHGGSTAVAIEPAPESGRVDASQETTSGTGEPIGAQGKWMFRLMVGSLCVFVVAVALLILFPAIGTLVSSSPDAWTSAP